MRCRFHAAFILTLVESQTSFICSKNVYPDILNLVIMIEPKGVDGEKLLISLEKHDCSPENVSR